MDGQQPRAADGSIKTGVTVPIVPASLTPWSTERLATCQSVPALEARLLAFREFFLILGEAAGLIEEQMDAIQGRLKSLRAERRRAKAATKRPPSKPRRPR